MLDFRPILFVIGLLLTTIAVAMGIPAIVDVLAGHSDWQGFAISSALTPSLLAIMARIWDALPFSIGIASTALRTAEKKTGAGSS